MKRKDLEEILTKNGVEANVKEIIDAFMKAHRNELNDALDSKDAEFEEVKKTLASDNAKTLEGYVKKADYDKALSDLENLKVENAKASRHSKYQSLKIKEKFFDYVDSKMKDSKDLDKDLEEFVKNNTEFLEVEEKKEENKFGFSAQKQTNEKGSSLNVSYQDVLSQYFKK